MPTITVEGVKYIGASAGTYGTWAWDTHFPVAETDSDGKQTLSREVKCVNGDTYKNLIAALAVGTVYTFGGKDFKLKSWNPITDNVFPGVTLLYAAADPTSVPADRVDNSINTRCSQKSATINNTSVAEQIKGAKLYQSGDTIPGSDPPDTYTEDETNEVRCTRDVTYDSPQTDYRYVKNVLPTAPIHSTIANGMSTAVRRSTITCVWQDRELVFSGNAPAAVVSALSMAEVAVVAGFSATETDPGVWECVDTVALELF